tara:strand:+ start:4944 stop:5555 length:612 start_codon:yes stop_codon:yes gene_type:complete
VQKKTINKNLIYLIILFFLASCTSVPKYPQDACKIFGEKYFYLKHSRAASEKWGIPISSILAVINKESGFRRFAKPKRTKLFKIIPYRRPSSSLGFSQAVDKTWELYKKENNKPRALRISFKNSSDFIGWYFWKTNKINKVSFTDTRNMYLNYYLGWQAYKNKAYQKDKKAIIFANKVEKQAKIYRSQLKECKSVLRKNYIIF